MHLTDLTIQGFKTFAVKTTLRFLPPKDGRFPVTSVVGPNGSGKSNVADAIRWVLGEQSLKLLRGKRSEDIIFSGSEGRGRSGFAEVSITFDNQDHGMPIDYGEVTITRRLYRDGESEYLLNDAPARLSDIQLLLAESGVGQRSYSVIGQGMIDHILVSSPEERKAFFDDATGVRPLQIKRHEAMLKLKRICENLSEVELLLNEIEPRLKSLKRQVSRLEQREEVERALAEASGMYYGTLWWKVEDQLLETRGREKALASDVSAAREGLKGLEARVDEIERAEKAEAAEEAKGDSGLIALQKQYQELQKRRTKLRDEHFATQKEMELAKVRAQSNWAPLPLSKIISELETLKADHGSNLATIRKANSLEEVHAILPALESTLERSTTLVGRLQRPAPEDSKADPALMKRLFELDEDQKAVEEELSGLEKQMEASAKSEKRVRTELIDFQRELRAKQQQMHLLESQKNGIAIELARLDERRGNLAREMDEQTKELAATIRQVRPSSFADTDALYPEIQRLRYKLELIGGIDPEIVKEYQDTNARFEFLDGQVKDLRGGIEATEKIVDELDAQIHDQSEKAFKAINSEFQKYFAVLFGGGSCALVKLTREDVKADEAVGAEGISPDRVSKDTVADEREEHEQDSAAEEVKSRIKEREDRVVGIDIQATPPGKKLKALNLLSGGERALTSIALVCAIMSVNPAPFVLLDEVDAALDEANTFRFANILETLSTLSQFIVITHNRATMEKADVLYGVTMNDDGVSNLLSVKLEDVAVGGTARH